MEFVWGNILFFVETKKNVFVSMSKIGKFIIQNTKSQKSKSTRGILS